MTEAILQAQPQGTDGRVESLPLAVDMDGTLLITDTLVETFVTGLFTQPAQTLRLLPAILRGRSAFKAALSDRVTWDVAALPARDDFIDFLRDEAHRGRPLYLVSAADRRLVEAVAGRFGLFDGAYGTRDGVNLKGSHKLEFLQRQFPEGFAYAGDAAADLHVWRGAQSIVIVGARRKVAANARKLGLPVEAEFARVRAGVHTWVKALRLHQWAKNILIFVPLFLGPNFLDPRHLATNVAGYVITGVAASATYLVNDLADLSNDRKHRSKRNRPFASGRLPVGHGLAVAPLMLLAAFAAAIALNPLFAVALAIYLATTLSYSFRLKRVAMLDVMVLAALYTLRIVMGTLLAGVEFSPWLVTFSGFFFFAMSLAKRHVEIAAPTGTPPDVNLSGRGYRPSDAPLTLAFGIAASVASVLVIVQYMMAEAFPSNVYAFPAALWAAPVLLGLWICRIWLLAQRGELDDDPVAFAVKDKISIGLGGILGVAFVIARL